MNRQDNDQKEKSGEGYHLKESEIMAGTADFRDGAFAFITEGTVGLRELGNYGVTEPIPNGESAITALLAGSGLKKIYGATSGLKSHLFYYDPSPAAEHVVDIGVVGENAQCRTLMKDKNGVLYGIANPGGRVFRYAPQGEFSVLWKSQVNAVRFLDASPGKDVSCAVLDPDSGRLFGMLRESSALFEIDMEKKSVRLIKDIEKAGYSNALALGKDGYLFGSCKNGHLFRYAIPSGSFEILDLQLPSPKGMEFLNYLDSAVFDGDRTIYAGTTLGTIFSFDTLSMNIVGYGRPVSDHRIRALALGNDRIVYGTAGSPGNNSHLFRWNPQTGEVKDLGIPMVHFPKNWVCYDISALAVGPNGEIYIGESERVSNLMIYYPPARR